MQDNFWIQKNILITGHTGFKGSWLALVLKTHGANVFGISLSEKIGIYETIQNNEIFKSELFSNICGDLTKIEEFILKNEIEIVFHFAAQSLVPTAVIKPQETLNTNIIGTYNILEVCNNVNSIKSIVVATTDKVYFNTEIFNVETDQLGGNEIYSISKVAGENIIKYFINEKLNNNLNISIVRSGNVIGGGDRGEGRLVTDIVKSINKEIVLNVRNPNGIRPWQDILDSIDGYMKVAKYTYSERKSEIFNLNSEENNNYSVKEIIKLFNSSCGREIDVSYENLDAFFETQFLRLNSQKAKNLLDWHPKVSIKESIDKIVQWEKHFQNTKNDVVSVEQIKKYYF